MNIKKYEEVKILQDKTLNEIKRDFKAQTIITAILVILALIICFKAWGFTYKTVAFNLTKIYPKTRNPIMGCGYWTRANGEICLLATKGKKYPRRICAGVQQAIIEPKREHSRKPDSARERIVQLLGDLPRIELFARQIVEGWDCWGNEV